MKKEAIKRTIQQVLIITLFLSALVLLSLIAYYFTKFSSIVFILLLVGLGVKELYEANTDQIEREIKEEQRQAEYDKWQEDAQKIALETQRRIQERRK